MGQHWMFLTFCGFLLVAVTGFCVFWTYGRIVLLGGQYRYRYTKVPSVISPSSLLLSPLRYACLIMPTLLRRVSFKGHQATDISGELGRYDA